MLKWLATAKMTLKRNSARIIRVAVGCRFQAFISGLYNGLGAIKLLGSDAIPAYIWALDAKISGAEKFFEKSRALVTLVGKMVQSVYALFC